MAYGYAWSRSISNGECLCVQAWRAYALRTALLEVEDDEKVAPSQVSILSSNPILRSSDPAVESKLASDAKKLRNTQASVQDMRVKLDSGSKSKRAKEFEFETMREQLQEVEETSVQLMETSSRLRNNIEKWGSSSSSKSCADCEDIGNSRRRRVYEKQGNHLKISVDYPRKHRRSEELQSEKKSTSTTGVYRFSQSRTNISCIEAAAMEEDKGMRASATCSPLLIK